MLKHEWRSNAGRKAAGGIMVAVRGEDGGFVTHRARVRLPPTVQEIKESVGWNPARSPSGESENESSTRLTGGSSPPTAQTLTKKNKTS